MQISAGDKLGPYEVLAAIVAGDIETVYRARATRLNRDVAIIVSCETFNDRYERVEKAIAGLSLLNIC